MPKEIKIDLIGFVQKHNQMFLQIGLNASPDEMKTLFPEYSDGECSLSYSLQIIAHKDGEVLREFP